ncbi:amino acid ABC transporter ATP-binding protein [Agrobacterium salinitolerans]|uniref:amino acid ABC transporter ATP-binding protein n=1 Tax=Agrobacterium salinitolerans TaxID=1183413 RepID=UPI0015745114|nr:amino acid ABC transporter ATP-binding protein [Agrobacterium salinitolerans]NTA40144.1 amino acid ABC transporter ATP-binding protein [Agrobacterium salinitolerans]
MAVTKTPIPIKSFAVQVRELSKWFGNFQVLNRIDLDISVGEKVVICGPSGSGKSTLIRCINQLEPFESGRLHVHGVEMSGARKDVQVVKQQIGMVFQHFNLFPHLNVMENCVLGPMTVRGLSRRQAEDIAGHYLSRVRISEQAFKYPGQLSGGQQQRVAIARALCMEPKILLFDEPTSALDPEMVKEILDTMTDLATDGITMICVTHEMGFARQVADRVIFMDKGQIVEVNRPDVFFKIQSNERTRQFLANLVR